ncbi:MAG: metal ABC transporter permease [Candidatus Thermoplasmatota archaeon]|jgi:zinc transport system permease protein|nr:metal ABC transporter permease [Candidatus Thermoplasmatota archaeon]
MAEIGLNDLADLLGYQFFQFALIGGILVAITCSWIGLFLILKKQSMITDGIAHSVFGGIALGLFLGINVLWTSLATALASMTGITYLRKKGMAQSDSAIAVMMALGFSTGLILISLAGGFNVDVFSYLFGSILTISKGEIYSVATVAILAIAYLWTFHRELLSLTFDEEDSRLLGLPVTLLSVSFNILVAVAIVISIKVVGIILVTAFMVLPGLTAIQFNLSFKGTAVTSILIGLVGVISGIFLSALFDVAASGVIVFVMVGIFVTSAIYNKLG